MELGIAVLIAITIIGLTGLPALGKFWHRHDWEIAIEAEHDSIYSNRTNYSAVYKCKNCRAFKVFTTNAKENNERV